MRNVFFVGAGGSLAAPAGLPLFRHLWQAAEIALMPALRGRLQYLAPEPLFRALRMAKVPVEDVLLQIFNSAGAEPNAVHRVLANQLLEGDVVWTTNYDTLIEEAVAYLAPSRTAEVEACERLRKRKPHGSFLPRVRGEWKGSKDLVFEADQVVVAWPAAIAELLEADCEGARLTLLGYSGIDVNSYEAVRKATMVAREVVWWRSDRDTSDDVTAIPAFRFPELDSKSFRHSDNPSRDFVLDAGAAADPPVFASLRPEHRRAEVVSWTFDSSPMTREVAQYETQAIIAREMGERAVSVLLFRAAARSGSRGTRELARMLKHSRPAQAVRSRARSIARRLPPSVPLTDAVKARAVTDLPLQSRKEAETVVARIERWERTVEHPVYKARLLLAGCSALRFLGRYTEALDKADAVREIARREGTALPTEAARAEFEALEALRTVGDFDQALERVRARVHTLGMSHWGAWFDYELAALYLQLRQPDDALTPLKRAKDFFWSIGERSTAYDPLPGKRFTRIVEIVWTRCAEGHDRAGELVRAWEKEYSRLALPPLYSSLVAFQAAEVERAGGHWEAAERRYESMNDDIEIHGGMKLLGRAMCRWGSGALPDADLVSAVAAFDRCGSVFGLAYCALLARELGVTSRLGRVDERDVNEVIRRIFRSMPWPKGATDAIVWT